MVENILLRTRWEEKGYFKKKRISVVGLRGNALLSSSRRCPLNTGLTDFELRERILLECPNRPFAAKPSRDLLFIKLWAIKNQNSLFPVSASVI